MVHTFNYPQSAYDERTDPESEYALRILEMFTNFDIGGGGVVRHISGLTKWLRDHGHHVWVAGSPGRCLAPEMDSGFLSIPLDRVTGTDILSREGLFSFVTCLRQLRRFVIRNRIQVIHAHETAPACVARLATLGLKVPVVFTCHGGPEERFRDIGLKGRHFTHRVIAVSQTMMERLEAAGIPRERLALVHYGIDHLPQSGDSLEAMSHRQRLLGSDGKWLAVTVARLHPQKGIDVLVKAARLVLATFPQVRFAVIGDGQEKGVIEALIVSNHLEEHFHLVGWEDNPRPYLEAADFFVLASRWEAAPLVIPEAFRAGLPVIATDVGGVREMIDHHVGSLVPAEDPEALAAAIVEMVRDESRHAEMAESARVRGRHSIYDPDSVYPALERVYREVIGL